MRDCEEVSTDVLLESIRVGENWRIIVSINFEECSIGFLRRLLLVLESRDVVRVELVLFRFASAHATAWSLLEIVKNDFVQDVQRLLKEKSFRIQVRSVPYPISLDVAVDLLFGEGVPPENIVVDFSALPKKAATYFADLMFQNNEAGRAIKLGASYAVITEPETSLERAGIGPFSVGQAKAIYLPAIVNREKGYGRISVLIFPGVEGFEAKQVVDYFEAPKADVTVALPFDKISMAGGLKELHANQALINDVAEQRISLKCYFSPFDALRVADEFVGRALSLIRDRREETHVIVVAPFGRKWSTIVGAYVRHRFISGASTIDPNVRAYHDVMTLSVSQYVSLHSIGCAETIVFKITDA